MQNTHLLHFKRAAAGGLLLALLLVQSGGAENVVSFLNQNQTTTEAPAPIESVAPAENADLSAAVTSTEAPAPANVGPTPAPTAYIGTPAPEDYVSATHPPFGWISVGPLSFNYNELTIDQRNELIHALQVANMLSSVEAYPAVAGLDTTREKPAYIGQRAVFMQQHTPLDGNQEAPMRINMSLASVVRGAEANALVQEMNFQNAPPDEGKEYLVATFEISIDSSDANVVVPFTMFEFEVVSAKGKVLPYAFVTDDLGTLSLYSGGTGTMRVTALAEPGQVVLLHYRGKVWFSTMTK